MEISNRHDWIVALLQRARRPQGEITPESLEENLRWLVRLAVPEVHASAVLQQRVRALTTIRRLWQRCRPVCSRPQAFAHPPSGGCLPTAKPWVAAPDRGEACEGGSEELGRWVRRGEVFTEREQRLLRLLLAADVQRLPEDALLREEAQQVMRQLLQQLPEPQREALLLQVRHGLSLPEIAHVLGLSEAQTSDLLRQTRTIIFGQGFHPFEA